MTDTRFETVFEDTDDLLGGVDVDEIGDVETLLMFLFARPVVVEEVWDDEGVTPSLEVIIQGNDEAIGSVCSISVEHHRIDALMRRNGG